MVKKRGNGDRKERLSEWWCVTAATAASRLTYANVTEREREREEKRD